MATSQTRRYTADFFCFEEGENRFAPSFRDLLEQSVNGNAPAHSIDSDQTIKYQIRSIRKTSNGNVYMAVFGKLRHGEAPEQATEHSEEVDVQLLPGHGLVEKSHFLFFADINLLVLQRNRNAGGRSHFQSYLNQPQFAERVLVPVLSKDAYRRLVDGGPIKRIEVSLRPPAFTSDEEDSHLKDFIKVFESSGASRMKMTLSVKTGESLAATAKNALLTLSKFGRTSIARATLCDEGEVVDLLVDRVTETFEVKLLQNGRPDPQSMFQGLAEAKDARASTLQVFFGT